jgi:glycine/D-amino acid oxidase-like deaminating enzyme
LNNPKGEFMVNTHISNSDAQNAAPLWRCQRDGHLPPPVSLDSDVTCEYAIVGAGIAGLAIAHRLSEKHDVVVLDANQIGEGSSGWNAGILSVATTIDLTVAEQLVGDDGVKLLLQTLEKVLGSVKERLALTDSDWQTGKSIYAANKKSDKRKLAHEAKIRCQFGLPTTGADKNHVHEFADSIAFGGEHAVHPVKLLFALAKATLLQGARLFENSPVESWARTQQGFTLKCGSRAIKAQHLILTTGLHVEHLRGTPSFARKMIGVSGHILVTAPSPAVQQLCHEGGTIALWDTARLYRYVRYLDDGRMLVGGEETPGCAKGTALPASDAAIQRLYRWAQEHHNFPLPPVEVAWRASLAVPAAGLPLLELTEAGGHWLISAVTDGLPSGMVLGETLHQLLDGDRRLGESLLKLFCQRRQDFSERLLSLVPTWKPLRKLVTRLAFAAMKLLDMVC